MSRRSAVNPLRRHMSDDMTLRNLSPAKQRFYLHALTKFSLYFGCSPDRLRVEDVRASRCTWCRRVYLPVGAQPYGLRAAILLRRDAGRVRDPRADCLCEHAGKLARS